MIIVPILISLAISAAMAAAASLIWKPKKQQAPNQLTTLTNRGAYLPVIIGRRIVGPIFAWAGDRTTSGGGGGKGFGSGGGSTDYQESGWHLLAVGPINKLHAIYANNKIIWPLPASLIPPVEIPDGMGGFTTVTPTPELPITNDTTPSGTTIHTLNNGSFDIYWGDVDQPPNIYLGNRKQIGITSRWPNICYVLWHRKNNHSSFAWPQLTYDIEATPDSSNLAHSDVALTSDVASGVNPAAALLQIITGPYPYGAGVKKEFVDGTTLEALGVLMQSEFLPMNLLIDGGQPAAQAIQGILQDAGVLMPQIGKRLAFMPMRAATSNPPSFGAETQAPPEFEREMVRGNRAVNRAIFIFKSEDNQFNDYDIKIEDDAEAEELTSSSPISVPITTVTNLFIASAVARRRTPEALGLIMRVGVQAIHGARQLVAGQLFDLVGFGRLRVMSTTVLDDSAEVKLDCMVDTYGRPDVADEQAQGGDSDTLTPVAPDLAFTYFELPPSISPTPALAVFRIRNDDGIVGAFVWASGDGSAYSQIGNQDAAAAGGTLLGSISATAGPTIARGPSITPLNDDIQDVLDLSGDTASWQSGVQLAVIDDEVMFLESITANDETVWRASIAYSIGDVRKPTVLGLQTGLRYKATTNRTSGTVEPAWPPNVGDTVNDNGVIWVAEYFTYQLNGLIRGRYGTTPAAHAIDAVVYIIPSANINIISTPLLTPGAHICLKTQPFTIAVVEDLTTVVAVCKDIAGLTTIGTVPYRLTTTGDYRMTSVGDNRTTVS